MAQLPQEASSMPEQWQLTLDVIKAKAQTLMIKNDGWRIEYGHLTRQMQEIRQSMVDGQNKNEQVSIFLKERHGRTDQQVHIDELTQTIRMKRQEAGTLDKEFENLQWKQADLEHKIQHLKSVISDTQLHGQNEKQIAQSSQNTAQSQGDDQLTPWRKRLEDENRQEVLLENELAALKTGDKTQDVGVDAIELQNKELEVHLDALRLQKLQHTKQSSDTMLAQDNARRYAQLKDRKDQLEANISAYEIRLDELRETSLMTLSWPLKKKKLIHEMVQTDARNIQMRDKIKELREDIDVLRDQVAKFERRINFANGQAIKNSGG